MGVPTTRQLTRWLVWRHIDEMLLTNHDWTGRLMPQFMMIVMQINDRMTRTNIEQAIRESVHG